MKKSNAPRISYFSMEIALEPDIPTYSGGLGILAGDTLRFEYRMNVLRVERTWPGARGVIGWKE